MNSTDDQTTIRSFPSYPDFRNPNPPMNPSPQDVIAPAVEQATQQLQNVQDQARRQVREHPIAVVLVALGVGLAAGVAIRLLTTPPPPPTTRQRIQRTLEDIQSRLAELAQPAYDRASALAGTGADALKKGMGHVQDMHLDQKFDGFVNRLKGYFG
jgi:ElaB/YqjD/DUF883 family membrane-anchored ribosome-binding protein